ncbi:hypothetical protein PoB_003911000 [Plakobranchus ocellatus]|uniref:Uncharacterized protein n=1 Tax=Plakobranchus ocellatus TaxID=259542 RepID=A0AAV4AZ73_9GAST|nr:hypothetical protein PoB_003911000 [Plakobranchus ocellatus]
MSKRCSVRQRMRFAALESCVHLLYRLMSICQSAGHIADLATIYWILRQLTIQTGATASWRATKIKRDRVGFHTALPPAFREDGGQKNPLPPDQGVEGPTAGVSHFGKAMITIKISVALPPDFQEVDSHRSAWLSKGGAQRFRVGL